MNVPIVHINRKQWEKLTSDYFMTTKKDNPKAYNYSFCINTLDLKEII